MERLEFVDLRETRVSRKGRHQLIQSTGAQVWLGRETNSFVARDCDDAALAELEWMPDLLSLTLSSPRLTDAGLQHLRHLTNLLELTLDHCTITDAGLAQVVLCQNLKQLRIQNLRVSDAGVAHLAQLAALESLDLSGLEIGDEAIEHLSGLTGLRILNLAGTRVSGTGIGQLAAASSSLVELNLRDAPVTAAGLREVAKLPALEYLKLAGQRSTMRELPLCKIRRASADSTWPIPTSPTRQSPLCHDYQTLSRSIYPGRGLRTPAFRNCDSLTPARCSARRMSSYATKPFSH
jgi:hypothetical protein